jgi:hypothetical protein
MHVESSTFTQMLAVYPQLEALGVHLESTARGWMSLELLKDMKLSVS